MKNITFLNQEKRCTGPQEIVFISSGYGFSWVFVGDSSARGIHLDLDQVEELHRRLGAHLEEHGRTPKVATPAKWRDG